MKRISVVWSLFLILVLTLLAGCEGDSSNNDAPLRADNINLIFVVSEDSAYNAPGDINPDTANLTSQGLQRSLLMATYLKEEVLGTKNVTGIYTLEPMTHLQTANSYPDMVPLMSVQQFALLNQITLSSYTANSYPLSASYSGASQGLDFNDQGGDNETLVSGIINANIPGFYVFSAPWETISSLMNNINNRQRYNLMLPESYRGPNYVYEISITLSDEASLVTYNSNLKPLTTYPVLPSPVASASCGLQTPFNISRTQGVDGAVIPGGININQTVYMIRHAEAHPISGFDDGNLVGAGQWRALALPGALRGKISPDMVYSIDPSLPVPLATEVPISYVRPSLTAEPYAIANNLPYYLAEINDFYETSSYETTSNFFFTGGNFSHQTILLAWEHDHFAPTINWLLSTYGGSGQTVDPDIWNSDDYDTIWTVTIDAQGNLTVDNDLCEGIDSTKLPATAPRF